MNKKQLPNTIPVVAARLETLRSIDIANPVVQSENDVHAITLELVKNDPSPQVFAFALDRTLHLRSIVPVYTGSFETFRTSPAEIYQLALFVGAFSLVMVHYHPETPMICSVPEQCQISRLVEASRLTGVPITDYVLVSPQKVLSLFEMGDLVEEVARV